MRGAAIEPPGAEYADAARSLARHDYAAAFVTGTTGVISPVYPVLLASASLLTQDVLSPAGTARLVTAAFGALLVVPVYLIAAFLYSRRVAAIAACAVALHPLLLKTSATALPDSIYVALLLAGTYFLLRLSRDRDTLSAITGGAFFGLAGLTSPEGVLCFIASVLIIALGVRRPWRETARQITVVLLAAAAVLAPYVALAIDAGRCRSETTIKTASLNLARLPAALTSLSLVASLVLDGFAALGLLWSRASGIAPQLLSDEVVIGGAMGSASLPAIGLLPVLLIWASRGVSELPRRLARSDSVSASYQPNWVAVDFAGGSVHLGDGSTGLSGCYRRRAGRVGFCGTQDCGWARSHQSRRAVMDASAVFAFTPGAQPRVRFRRRIPEPRSKHDRPSKSILSCYEAVMPAAHLISATGSTHGIPIGGRGSCTVGSGQRRERLPSTNGSSARTFPGPNSVLHDSGNQAGPRDESAALDQGHVGEHSNGIGRNRRYFTDESGRAIYLTGAHTWANLQDGDRSEPLDRFDFERYLTFLQNHS